MASTSSINPKAAFNGSRSTRLHCELTHSKRQITRQAIDQTLRNTPADVKALIWNCLNSGEAVELEQRDGTTLIIEKGPVGYWRTIRGGK
jgi:hypothetical protein